MIRWKYVAASLVVRFAIKTDNNPRLDWEQRFNFDVQNISVVVPQSSPHPGFEALDVQLDVDICDEGQRAGNRVCFTEVSESAEGVQMLEGVAVRIARGARAERDDMLHVRTSGWPSPIRWERWLALVAALLGLGVGIAFAFRARRHGASKDFDALSLLDNEKKRTLEEISELHKQRDNGAVLAADFETEEARLRDRLAGVHRRIRERTSGAGT